MFSGREERALAAQGSECPLGESTSTRDVAEMKSRIQSPIGTCKIAVQSPNDRKAASVPQPSPGTSQFCRKVYNRIESFAGGTLGPTRALLDMRKQRLRRNRTEKLQSLNSARKGVEKLYAGMSQMFEELESTLLTHPAYPSMHVQTVSTEFNVKSAQLQEMQKKMSVLKNELQLIDNMLKTRSDPVLPREQMNTSTTSKQISRKESDIVPEVCGFPIYENPFDQLSVFESHTEGQKSEMIPEEVEELNDVEIYLTDPRTRRTQKLQSKGSKSSISVAEPVMSMQNVTDSVLMAQVSKMTEQAIEMKKSVPTQNAIQISDQSMQKISSTVKSKQQSSIQSAHRGAVRPVHANTDQSAHTGARESDYTAAVQLAQSGAEESVKTVIEESAHKGAEQQENIPLSLPTVELNHAVLLHSMVDSERT